MGVRRWEAKYTEAAGQFVGLTNTFKGTPSQAGKVGCLAGQQKCPDRILATAILGADGGNRPCRCMVSFFYGKGYW